jgi:hypothetical protein
MRGGVHAKNERITNKKIYAMKKHLIWQYEKTHDFIQFLIYTKMCYKNFIRRRNCNLKILVCNHVFLCMLLLLFLPASGSVWRSKHPSNCLLLECILLVVFQGGSDTGDPHSPAHQPFNVRKQIASFIILLQKIPIWIHSPSHFTLVLVL